MNRRALGKLLFYWPCEQILVDILESMWYAEPLFSEHLEELTVVQIICFMLGQTLLSWVFASLFCLHHSIIQSILENK